MNNFKQLPSISTNNKLEKDLIKKLEKVTNDEKFENFILENIKDILSLENKDLIKYLYELSKFNEADFAKAFKDRLINLAKKNWFELEKMSIDVTESLDYIANKANEVIENTKLEELDIPKRRWRPPVKNNDLKIPKEKKIFLNLDNSNSKEELDKVFKRNEKTLDNKTIEYLETFLFKYLNVKLEFWQTKKKQVNALKNAILHKNHLYDFEELEKKQNFEEEKNTSELSEIKKEENTNEEEKNTENLVNSSTEELKIPKKRWRPPLNREKITVKSFIEEKKENSKIEITNLYEKDETSLFINSILEFDWINWIKEISLKLMDLIKNHKLELEFIRKIDKQNEKFFINLNNISLYILNLLPDFFLQNLLRKYPEHWSVSIYKKIISECKIRELKFPKDLLDSIQIKTLGNNSFNIDSISHFLVSDLRENKVVEIVKGVEKKTTEIITINIFDNQIKQIFENIENIETLLELKKYFFSIEIYSKEILEKYIYKLADFWDFNEIKKTKIFFDNKISKDIYEKWLIKSLLNSKASQEKLDFLLTNTIN